MARTDRLARACPRRYRLTAFGTLALGYGGCAALAAAPVAAAAIGVLAIARAEPLIRVVMAAAVLVGLAVLCVPRCPAVLSPGEHVDETQAPELLQLISRLRARLKLRYPRELRIIPQFDAALFQASNRGLFGGGARCSVLLLGLPLLKCLTVPQLEAIVAHELGHLAGTHAAGTSRARHLECTLERLRLALQPLSDRFARTLLRCCDWYLPRLRAWTLPLARANEADADRIAVQLTSPPAFAQALVAHRILGRYWRHYWAGIHSRMRFLPHPAAFPYRGFGPASFMNVPECEWREWLDAALRLDASFNEAHPCLRERLRCAGAAAELALPPPGLAAAALLGSEGARLEALFDRRWREGIAATWHLVYEACTRVNSSGT